MPLEQDEPMDHVSSEAGKVGEFDEFGCGALSRAEEPFVTKVLQYSMLRLVHSGKV